MLLVGVGKAEDLLGVFVGVVSVELVVKCGWGWGGCGCGRWCRVDFFLNRPRRSLRNLLMFSLCFLGEKVGVGVGNGGVGWELVVAAPKFGGQSAKMSRGGNGGAGTWSGPWVACHWARAAACLSAVDSGAARAFFSFSFSVACCGIVLLACWLGGIVRGGPLWCAAFLFFVVQRSAFSLLGLYVLVWAL